MKLGNDQQNAIKDILGKKAASLVEDGMLVGLGSGTTSHFFIQHLIKRCHEGLNIRAVSSSFKSATQAKEGGIPIIDINQITHIDLTIDGADEIDPENRMIKGGGGALLREKIIAMSSEQMIIIVDESKLVSELGQFGLPIEILPFGVTMTIAKLEKLGYKGNIRKKSEDETYITDNGNYIYDIHIPDSFPEPEEDYQKINNIPGVIETGFFFNIATQVLVGYSDGNIHLRS